MAELSASPSDTVLRGAAVEGAVSLTSQLNLASVLWHRGSLDEAEQIFVSAHAVSLEHRGTDDPLTEHAAGALAALRASR